MTNCLHENGARVTPIIDNEIGGMLTSKCLITQANRTIEWELI